MECCGSAWDLGLLVVRMDSRLGMGLFDPA